MHKKIMKYFLLITTVVWIGCGAGSPAPIVGKGNQNTVTRSLDQQLSLFKTELDALQVRVLAAARVTDNPQLGEDSTTTPTTKSLSERAADLQAALAELQAPPIHLLPLLGDRITHERKHWKG